MTLTGNCIQFPVRVIHVVTHIDKTKANQIMKPFNYIAVTIKSVGMQWLLSEQLGPTLLDSIAPVYSH